MRSIGDLVGETTPDATPDRECYRCDRDVVTEQLFRLALQPSAGLSSRYKKSAKYCCPDCAAALGMLEHLDS